MMLTILTHYDPKPTPNRNFDWEAVTDCYDEGSPVGYGRTRRAAVNDLADQLEV